MAPAKPLPTNLASQPSFDRVTTTIVVALGFFFALFLCVGLCVLGHKAVRRRLEARRKPPRELVLPTMLSEKPNNRMSFWSSRSTLRFSAAPGSVLWPTASLRFSYPPFPKPISESSETDSTCCGKETSVESIEPTEATSLHSQAAATSSPIRSKVGEAAQSVSYLSQSQNTATVQSPDTQHTHQAASLTKHVYTHRPLSNSRYKSRRVLQVKRGFKTRICIFSAQKRYVRAKAAASRARLAANSPSYPPRPTPFLTPDDVPYMTPVQGPENFVEQLPPSSSVYRALATAIILPPPPYEAAEEYVIDEATQAALRTRPRNTRPRTIHPALAAASLRPGYF
ncbi:hypothetical protein BV25DRAFT_116381 [Artomyces pyxidatus]|uniref:Uncharacterized protein n=1 Tax=Artomyces pyxidatus TaxID=48021 RepID=A0ACB8TL90_9AGAM|nr:hypothetical protein BV25DRAFT_116381 [Artomyces pyxidatus]